MAAARRSTGIARHRHTLGLKILVLVPLGELLGVKVSVDFGHREQEDLVGRVQGLAVLGVGLFRDGLHLGLELGGQEYPEVTGIEAGTELGFLPTVGVVVHGAHSLGIQCIVRRLERQSGSARAVGEPVVVDADDSVLERLAVSQLDGPFRPRIHGGLGLGVDSGILALGGDVLGHGLLVVERPVGGVLFLQLLDSCTAGAAAFTAGISASGPAGAVSFGKPARDAVAGLRDLPGDLIAEGKKPAADHDRNDDDDDVFDDSGTEFRIPPT